MFVVRCRFAGLLFGSSVEPKGKQFVLNGTGGLQRILLELGNGYRTADPSQIPNLFRKSTEAPFAEQCQQALGVPGLHAPGFPVDWHGDMAVQLNKFASQRDGGLGGTEAFLFLGAGHFVDIRQQVVECAELLQQLGSRLLADAGHTLDIVNRVANERLEVDDLFGRDAPILQQAGAVKGLVLAKVVKTNPVVDKLPAILVAGAEEDVQPALGRLTGDRGEDVVRLVAGDAQAWNAQRFQQLPNQGQLRLEVVRHGSAVRLVFREEVIPKRRPRFIERRQQVGRLLFIAQIKKVARKAEQGIGR